MRTQQRVGTGTPGVMTMAMNAATGASGPKVLRIGVLQGGRIVEERVIRGREPVSVGTTERNTFSVGGPGVAAHHELFARSGEGYALRFDDAIEGRVATADGMKTLAQLKADGTAKPSGRAWQLELDERSRGKLVVGDTTLLFQFVAPPPVRPKPQLPAAIRSGVGRHVDWLYNASLAFFLVGGFSSIGYVEYLYDPILEDSFSLDARIVTLAQPPAPVEPVVQQAVQPSASPSASAAPEPSATASARPAHRSDNSRAHATQADPSQRVEVAVSTANRAANAATRAADAAVAALGRSADVRLLVGALDTGRGNARDRFAEGGIQQETLAALEGTTGIQRGNANTGLVRRGIYASTGPAGPGTIGRGRELGPGGTGPIGAGAEVRENIVHSNVRLLEGGENLDGDGRLDGDAIARGVRNSLSGIRSCYERQIRINPQLQGRLEIRFTIGTTGRVTASRAAGLSASPEAGTCIESVVRRIVFPAPVGGSVDTSFSFNFTPGG